jgi:hypothetical protein
MKKILVWGSICCLIFVFGFLSGSFWATKKFFKSFSIEDFSSGDDKTFFSPRDIESHFYGNIYWGGSFKPTNELEPLPKGDAKIRIKFNYNDNPAAGVGFFLALNGKYRTGNLKSDVDGVAEVTLPFGQWHLNRLECKQWSGRPQGKFILISGDEPKLGTRPFNELFFSFGNEGKTLVLSKESKPAHSIPVEIRERIKIIWPLPGEPKQNATVSGSAIKWEPYPKAASYVVQINHVTREKPRTTTYSPLIHKQIIGENFLPISQLPSVESDIPPKEYSIEIRAYGQDGAFLSESEHSFSTFSLRDNHVLVEFDGSEGQTFDQADIEGRFNAEESLDAVVMLINKALFAEAERLLELSDTSTMPARTALLKGYLSASQGNCEKANKYFEESLSLGQKCIPERYRMSCFEDDKSNKKL